ncbi:MAG: hypothetical protein KJ052_05390, partial [Candidatus Hydrogenedentes bacterium]|nr:hypothetical protein [Candidatus Hydrogenedentota bacterium]
FVVFCIPSVVELSGDFQAQVREKHPQLQLVYDKPARKLVEIGARHGFPVLDLAPVFKAADTDSAMSYYHTRSDKHWNAAGHALAADALIAFLDERRLLPSSGSTP